MNPAGLLRVATLALTWGRGFLLITISLRGFTPVQLTFARLALGAVVIVLILAAMMLKLPGERRLWVHLVVAALLANAIPYTLFGIAEQTVDSNLAGAINATTLLWTVLFALIARRHDPLSPMQWAGMVLGFAGALLILSPSRANSATLPGVLACVGASASYGLSNAYDFQPRPTAGRTATEVVQAPTVVHTLASDCRPSPEEGHAAQARSGEFGSSTSRPRFARLAARVLAPLRAAPPRSYLCLASFLAVRRTQF